MPEWCASILEITYQTLKEQESKSIDTGDIDDSASKI